MSVTCEVLENGIGAEIVSSEDIPRIFRLPGCIMACDCVGEYRPYGKGREGKVDKVNW